MRNLFHENEYQLGWTARLRRILLDLDARIDFGIYLGRTWGRELYERYTVLMDRFHVSGWRRWSLVEPISEGLTLGTGGLVVMLALAVPAFRETSDEDWLKRSDLAVTFLDRYGNEIGSRGIRHNDSIPLDEFPDYLIKATLATEDRRFYEHFGIDVGGTFRALLTNARAGGVVQGGSSITQQLAKNLFLSNERTIERKINEAFLATWLEFRLPKNEILKLYLDRAYLGGGTFGVDAAAQYYFNKSARDVNLAEAAMLAGLFKAPSKFAPHINLPASRARANVVLDNLVEAGFMTEGQVFGARRKPATPVDRRDEISPNYYLDWAFDEMKKIADRLPKTVHDRVFVARLAIDLNLQRNTEKAVENSLRQYGREYHAKQAATVLMDTDGAVRAMVGGRDYGESQFNRATDALRQPGSSFKPYVYATALASGGFKPTSVVVDSPVCIGNWCPKNYSGGFSGSMTLTQALVRSINVIPVKLSIALGNGNPKIGRAKIRETARKAGLRTPLPDTPSMPIGADEVTVLDHTGGYGIFVNEGKSITPHAVLEVRNGAGDLIWRFDRDGKKPEQVIPPQVAHDMVAMMNKVVEDGTGKRAMLDGIKAAGKTGTTNSYRDAWFVGYTGNFIAGVWFGNDDYTSTNRMTGGSLPAQTWHEIMDYAHQGVELKPIPGLAPPSGARVNVAQSSSKGDAPQRPSLLTKRAADILVRVEQLMDDAAHALASRDSEGKRAAADGETAAPGPPIRLRPLPTDPRAAAYAATEPNHPGGGPDMRLLFGFLLTLAVAAAIGLGTTWIAVTQGAAYGGITIGAWTAWPKVGTPEIDPYARAMIARSGELPIGSGDGVAFSARADDNGRPLDGRCEVAVAGMTPQARYWTLTLYDLAGRLVANSIARYGFTSQEIVRRADGVFEVTASPRARPGNWLPTGAVERYVLVLRLYDTPVGVATRTGRDAPMPTITRGQCQ